MCLQLNHDQTILPFVDLTRCHTYTYTPTGIFPKVVVMYKKCAGCVFVHPLLDIVLLPILQTKRIEFFSYLFCLGLE